MNRNLYEKWARTAYDNRGISDKKFWTSYMPLEQRVYEDMLESGESGESGLKGRLSDVAEKYGMKPEYVVGFLDGIKEALNEEIDLNAVGEDYEINISFDNERLFKKMVEYKADHLYTLPQWDRIFGAERREELIEEQKKSGTVVRGEKPGRNDPCPCGSGKKYKKCCGALAG